MTVIEAAKLLADMADNMREQREVIERETERLRIRLNQQQRIRNDRRS